MDSSTSRRGIARRVAAATPPGLVITGFGAGEAGGSGGGERIKVGILRSLTAAWAEDGRNPVNGAPLAIENVNAAGGVEALNGAQLEAVGADTSSADPGKGASGTRQLVHRDKVSALIASYVSALSLTASTKAERTGAPMLIQAFTNALTARGNRNLFQLPTPSPHIDSSTVPYVRDAFAAPGTKLQRVAVVSSNDAALQAEGRQKPQRRQESLGLSQAVRSAYLRAESLDEQAPATRETPTAPSRVGSS